MTPCSYDARNYQPDREPFAALDLWNCLNFADTSSRSEIDCHIYYPVERVIRSMSVPTMNYTFNQPTGEILDDDGQIVATLSDNALPEQGEALVRAYNSDNGKLEACLKRFFCNFGHLCSYEDREEAQKLLSHSLGPTT